MGELRSAMHWAACRVERHINQLLFGWQWVSKNIQLFIRCKFVGNLRIYFQDFSFNESMSKRKPLPGFYHAVSMFHYTVVGHCSQQSRGSLPGFTRCCGQ